MPKLEITINESAMIAEALEMAIKSAKRAQTSGKTPQIREVYKTHERELNALVTKIDQAK